MSRRSLLSAPMIPRIIWALSALVLLHIGLLYTLDDLSAPRALIVQLLPPSVTIGAALILVLTAQLHGPGRARRAWLVIATGMLLGAAGSLLDLYVRSGGVLPARSATALFLLAYLFSIIGVALYFPYRSLWTGDTRRLILDSIAVGYAMLIIGQHGLTQQFQERTWFATVGDVGYLAFNSGVLFALLVLYTRYGVHGGPLLVLIALSVGCVVIADLIAALFPLLSWDARWRNDATAPLFALQTILITLGAYRSLSHPPQLRAERPEPTPLLETIIWTLPRGLLLGALIVGALFPTPAAFLAFLFAIAFLHEATAIYDQQRVWRALAAMTNRERQARELVRFFQHELKGYTTGLAGLAPLLRAKLAGQNVQTDTERLLDALDRNVGHLTTLLHMLLIVTRDGVLPSEQCRRMPIAQVFTAVQADLSAAIMQHSVSLNIDAPEQLDVQVHPFYVSLAITTAVRNALESADPATPLQRLALSACVCDARVVVRIEDDGPGFAPDMLAQLSHEELLLASGLSKKPSGYGLGLPLIARVAYLHGGSVRCGNLQNAAGAWIEFDLPKG